MIYLACPFSHPAPEVRARRSEAATEVAAMLMLEGETVFSPLTQGPEMVRVVPDLVHQPESWWMGHWLNVVRRCRAVYVLTLEGWEQSAGVSMEIAEAEARGIPVFQVLWAENVQRWVRIAHPRAVRH